MIFFTKNSLFEIKFVIFFKEIFENVKIMEKFLYNIFDMWKIFDFKTELF